MRIPSQVHSLSTLEICKYAQVFRTLFLVRETLADHETRFPGLNDGQMVSGRVHDIV
jgi:hypothetical protein